MGSPRRAYALRFLLVVVLGLVTILYRGPGSDWVSNQLGGTFYVLAWIFLILTVLPSLAPSRVCLAVLVFTCAIEFLQLWHPPALQAIRATFFGRVLLGSSFTWTDFPYYFLGAALGLVLARRSVRSSSHASR